jgi:hypothetical protein
MLWVLHLGLAIVGLWRADGRALAALALLLLAFVITSPGLIAHNEFRYLQPLGLPLLLAGLLRAAQDRRFGFGLILAALIVPAAQLPGELAGWHAQRAAVAGAQQEIAGWLNARETPGVPVLVHDAGYLSEATHAHLTDLVGLKTASSVDVHRRISDGPAALHAIACASQPRYVVIFSGWDRVFQLRAALEVYHWQPELVLQPFEPGETYALYRVSRSPACD